MESSDLFPLKHNSSSSAWLSALVSGHVLRAAPHPSIRQKAQPGFNLKAGGARGGHTSGLGRLAVGEDCHICCRKLGGQVVLGG